VELTLLFTLLFFLELHYLKEHAKLYNFQGIQLYIDSCVIHGMKLSSDVYPFITWKS